MNDFMSWFKKLKWLKIPIWVWMIIGGGSNSIKITTNLVDFLIDFIGGQLFMIVCFYVYYLIKVKPNIYRKDEI